MQTKLLATLFAMCAFSVLPANAQKTEPKTMEEVRLADDQRRREDYIKENPGLSLAIKQAILRGDLAFGMSRSAVAAAIGYPIRKTRKASSSGEATETWVCEERKWKDHDQVLSKVTYVTFEDGIIISWDITDYTQ